MSNDLCGMIIFLAGVVALSIVFLGSYSYVRKVYQFPFLPAVLLLGALGLMWIGFCLIDH
jgi:hypothetical protein